MSEGEVRGAPDVERKPESTAESLSGNKPQAQGGASAPSSVPSPNPPATSATEDEDESEDESFILEESPCGRWQKRREEVTACHVAIEVSSDFRYSKRFVQLKISYKNLTKSRVLIIGCYEL